MTQGLRSGDLNSCGVPSPGRPPLSPKDGSGQWAAAAGRQVGLWVHTEINDPQREIESHGRQGSRNNFPRSVIEWDEGTNEYVLLGSAAELNDEAKEQTH